MAGHTSVFQRTPPWVLPRDDRPSPEWRRRLYARVPFLQRLHRWRVYARQELLALAFIGRGRVRRRHRGADRRGGSGPHRRTRRRSRDAAAPHPRATSRGASGSCWPTTGTRPWPATMSRSSTCRSPRSSPKGFAPPTACSTSSTCSCSRPASPPQSSSRRFGSSAVDGVELTDHWRAGAATHLGTAVSGFPNLFLLVGPGTTLGHNSIVFMIEAQLRWVTAALGESRRLGGVALELRPEVEQARVRRATASDRGHGLGHWLSTPGTGPPTVAWTPSGPGPRSSTGGGPAASTRRSFVRSRRPPTGDTTAPIRRATRRSLRWTLHTGCGAAWLARRSGGPKVVGSNPASPTTNTQLEAPLRRGLSASGPAGRTSRRSPVTEDHHTLVDFVSAGFDNRSDSPANHQWAR